MNSRGKEAESQALKWLLSKKLTLIVANYSCRQGEIDLIMQDRDVLVFIEVRLRSNKHFGGAANSVDYKKQQKIAIAAQHFLMCHTKYSQYSCRFDVIAFESISADIQPIWYKDAFRL